MSQIYARNSRLTFMARYIEGVVPEYDIKQSDPLVAVRAGVGNCVAKAVLSGIFLEHTQLRSPTLPALAWNRNTHPKRTEDMLGRVNLLNGHAMLLAANSLSDDSIACLAYNPMGIKTEDWEIDDFNNIDEHAEIKDGLIVPTSRGLAAGYVIEEWHEGGRQYMESLGAMDSVYHAMDREEMSEEVMHLLRSRELLRSFNGL